MLISEIYRVFFFNAKFQTPPLRRRMFVINTTTVVLLRRNKWCLGKSEISKFFRGVWAKHHFKFHGVWAKHHFKFFLWCLTQTPRFLSGIWLKFWNLEALIWAESGVINRRLTITTCEHFQVLYKWMNEWMKFYFCFIETRIGLKQVVYRDCKETEICVTRPHLYIGLLTIFTPLP